MNQTIPAELLEMRGNDETIQILLDAAGHCHDVEIRLSLRTLQALPHILALAGHDLGCVNNMDLGVGLLLRTVEALGGTSAAIVIRARPTAAFWLRIATPDGASTLDLDVLDGFALLASRRLPIEVVAPHGTDWDAELSQLLDGGTGG